MTDRARPGLVALYDIRPGNGAGQFLQPQSPHGAKHWTLHTAKCTTHSSRANTLVQNRDNQFKIQVETDMQNTKKKPLSDPVYLQICEKKLWYGMVWYGMVY